jgi:hypothetical protein
MATEGYEAGTITWYDGNSETYESGTTTGDDQAEGIATGVANTAEPTVQNDSN